MKNPPPYPQIIGLSKHLTEYRLAVFEYFATGEGLTVEMELLNSPDQKITIGFPNLPNGGAKIINCVRRQKKTVLGATCQYLDFNPEFVAKFHEGFGFGAWAAFKNCCVQHGNVLDLKVKMYYNLS